MSQIEFSRWYHQVGQDMAEVVAEFYGVPLRQVAAWEVGMGTRPVGGCRQAAGVLAEGGAA